MADVKWIKITTDIFDNRKFKVIETMPDGDAITVIWFKLLCLAGTTNDNGFVYFTKEIPFTDELMASVFGKSLPLIRLALETFKQFGMIETIDNVLHISNWEKYQNVTEMDKIREQNRIRQKRWYDKVHQIESGDAEPNVRLTSPNGTDKNKNKSKESNTNVLPKKANFTAPTLEEITSYFIEKGSSKEEAEKFYYFYSSKNWMVGKNKMSNWKMAGSGWISRNNKETSFDTYAEKLNQNYPHTEDKSKYQISSEEARKIMLGEM